MQRVNGATPTGVTNANPESFVEGSKIGMKVATALTASTGNASDLSDVPTREFVDKPKEFSGFCKEMVASQSYNTDWMMGSAVELDVHWFDISNNGFEQAVKAAESGAIGGWNTAQMDLWKDGQNERAVPNSGYVIKRTWQVDKTGARIKLKLHIEKVAAAVAFGAFSSTKGPSPACVLDLEIETSIPTASEGPSDDFFEALGLGGLDSSGSSDSDDD